MSTRTGALFPYTTPFRSLARFRLARGCRREGGGGLADRVKSISADARAAGAAGSGGGALWAASGAGCGAGRGDRDLGRDRGAGGFDPGAGEARRRGAALPAALRRLSARSAEHTSELQ